MENPSENKPTNTESTCLIPITFKVSGGTEFEDDIDTSWTVLAVKEKVANKSGIPAEQQRLIYRGRILKDPDIVSSYNVLKGHSMHLVKRAGTTTAEKPASAPEVNATPSQGVSAPYSTPLNSGPGINPASIPTTTNPSITGSPDYFANIMGSDMFSEYLNSMQGEISGLGNFDPALLSSLMANPAVQQMVSRTLSDPEVMRAIAESYDPANLQRLAAAPSLQSIASNPLLQTLLQRGVAAAPTDQGAANTGNTANLPTGTSAPGGNPLGDLMNNMMLFSQMFPNIGQMRISDPASSNNPTEYYRTQLEQLREMGFVDSQLNIQMLQESNGDVNAAITRLLQRGFGN